MVVVKSCVCTSVHRAPTILRLADLALVSETDGAEQRITGGQIARLLAFAEAWAPGWDAMLEAGAEEVPDALEALASLLHHAEESANAIDAPPLLHFVHEVLQTMAARLVAAREDPLARARRYTVEVARPSGGASGGSITQQR